MVQLFSSLITDMTRTNADLVREMAETQVKLRQSILPCQNSISNDYLKLMGAPLQFSFDLTKDAYINAAKSGLVEPSLISSTKVFKAIDSLEKATLGVMARS